MFNIDLHTHSEASHDGGITLNQYERTLNDNVLDCIAITDHNRIDFALRAREILGEKIIVGEEIMTSEGEVIGLFLNAKVEPHQPIQMTVNAIKEQGGIVYIPHPFETVRKGLHPKTIEQIQQGVDIIEVCNGRAFAQNKSQQAVVWSRINNIPGAASSDAHGVRGLGKTYTAIAETPTKDTLVSLVNKGTLHAKRPGLRALLYPKYNKTKKLMRRGS